MFKYKENCKIKNNIREEPQNVPVIPDVDSL